ncbi:ACT domain-containing protein ACR9-like [Impatiens glandulifera]|uniref:ACT domain-containing protein ACR9-like n=1 Tax=Impatiens glandulifera TaxID=253017 RepID=UPI001FB108F3|nr:ACT domain-containing protein ACR9-like [Impatiens glandulifera]
MGIRWEDAVLFQPGKTPGDPTLITANCPDKAGLGCDLCRIILEFGLCITRGDFQTDGKWCYIVLWTVPQESSTRIEWDSLKHRLQAACPSWSIMSSFHFNQPPRFAKASPVYLLKVFCLDRKGLLHDVTKVLSKLDLTIQRVKVTTTPDDKVLDLFFITDTMDLLHTEERRDETCRHLAQVLKEHCISCELQLSGPEFENQQGALMSFSSEVAEELFSCELSSKEMGSLHPLSSEMKKVKKASITVDNHMSPSHTLLQIQCIDQKSLVYDILRTSKDCDIQIAYGRISPTVDGCRNVDLFIQKKDGGKIVDPEILTALCSRLKEEMLHPLRVTIASRGPDTILLVANPVEVSGFGRPRVFYDVTLALKLLGICIFSAEVVRHSTSDRKWEVYRFLLDDIPRFPIASQQRSRVEIIDKVRKTLMIC